MSKGPAKANDRRGTPKGKGQVKTKSGGRIGNPPYEPSLEDRIKVEVLAANGFTHEMIAVEIQRSADTVERHFEEELKSGELRLRARVGATIAQQALAGCRKSQRLFMDRRGGPEWKPTSGLELSGPGGKPIESRDMTHLSEEQLAALAALDGDQ